MAKLYDVSWWLENYFGEYETFLVISLACNTSNRLVVQISVLVVLRAEFRVFLAVIRRVISPIELFFNLLISSG